MNLPNQVKTKPDKSNMLCNSMQILVTSFAKFFNADSDYIFC